MSALNEFTRKTGLGWGGKKQWVVDKDAAIGMATYNKGSLAFFAIEKTSGTSITKPAL
jgi:hypothetical protein